MNITPLLLAVTVQASMVLHLAAPPDTAFPLFDPVNESKWDPSWKPQLLGDRVAQGLVFLTDDERGRAIWLLDRYDPQTYTVRYVVTSPRVLDQIDISLRGDGAVRSIATVTYTRTALDRSVEDDVRALPSHMAKHAVHWESAINAVLNRER
ncbi:MAG TPA: hypothetical protein VGZ02_00305 [Candidatus Baltobacteraceae bacterium]|jgi:hypothetical protein|nr:hypothetical protein [Candidatus Baltobacteraceae bacterium]